jgi:hypothetical protein
MDGHGRQRVTVWDSKRDYTIGMVPEHWLDGDVLDYVEREYLSYGTRVSSVTWSGGLWKVEFRDKNEEDDTSSE